MPTQIIVIIKTNNANNYYDLPISKYQELCQLLNPKPKL